MADNNKSSDVRTKNEVVQENLFAKEDTSNLQKFSKVIKSEMDKIEISFVKVAFALYQVHDKKLHKILGYKDIYTFAKEEFNIARGTTSNFINIVLKFCKCVDGNKVPVIEDDFKGFKSSQLIAMLGMDSKQLKDLSPDMTVRDIKAIGKEYKGQNDAESSQVEKSQNNKETIDVECKDVNLIAEIESFDDIKQYEKVIVKLLSQGHKIQIVDVIH